MTKSKHQAERSGHHDPGVLIGKRRQGGIAVQTGGAVRGAKPITRHGRLEALVTIAVVVFAAAIMVVTVWAGSALTGGVGTDTAVPARAGNAFVQDDAGNMGAAAGAGTATVHDDAGALNPGLAPGGAVIHDDAGNVGR